MICRHQLSPPIRPSFPQATQTNAARPVEASRRRKYAPPRPPGDECFKALHVAGGYLTGSDQHLLQISRTEPKLNRSGYLDKFTSTPDQHRFHKKKSHNNQPQPVQRKLKKARRVDFKAGSGSVHMKRGSWKRWQLARHPYSLRRLSHSCSHCRLHALTTGERWSLGSPAKAPCFSSEAR